MLVLSRKSGEKLIIGNEIVVEVLAINGDVVKLGITAPRATSVHRFEVFAEIEAANRAALASCELEREVIERMATRLKHRRSTP
ncbi:MAG: carbon storage regulator [Pyrinomonas sp.]|uniref:carbon storage regulator CsrA n=1 Tax=Pyrinomonas sp. TaxID=2080306 RepID=UPI00332D0C03